eukprot:293411_1
MAAPKSLEANAWILIAGTTKFPDSIKTSDKKRVNGNYLSGVSCDLTNMEQWITTKGYGKLYNVVRNMQNLKCQTVLDNIKECAANIKQNGVMRIFYTGHGQLDTGNWCFCDGVISLDDVIQSVQSKNNKCIIRIYCDCCYSGNWVMKLCEYKRQNQEIWINAASWPGQVAWDTKNGGMFTLEFVANNGKAWTDNKGRKDTSQLKKCLGVVNAFGPYRMEYCDFK